MLLVPCSRTKTLMVMASWISTSLSPCSISITKGGYCIVVASKHSFMDCISLASNALVPPTIVMSFVASVTRKKTFNTIKMQSSQTTMLYFGRASKPPQKRQQTQFKYNIFVEFIVSQCTEGLISMCATMSARFDLQTRIHT